MTLLSAIRILACFTGASIHTLYVCPDAHSIAILFHLFSGPNVNQELLLLQPFATLIGLAMVSVSELPPKIQNRIQIP